MGKETGINQGKGGSMHLSDFSVGSLGETSIVGSGLPVAAGAALGSKLKGDQRVTLCFFGDGASNQGTFHESLNLAAIWDLPVVYVCENNQYGELTRPRRPSRSRMFRPGPAPTASPERRLTVRTCWPCSTRFRRPWTGPAAGMGPVWSRPRPTDSRITPSASDPGLPLGRRGRGVDHSPRPAGPFPCRLAERGIDAQDLEQIDKEVSEEVAAAVEFARAGRRRRQSGVHPSVHQPDSGALSAQRQEAPCTGSATCKRSTRR